MGLLPSGDVVTDVDVIVGSGTDWTGRVTATPAAVVRPASSAVVAEVMRWATRHRVGITAQGGNTGLVGGAIAAQGEICLQLGRLDQLGEVDEFSGQVTVGAGVTLEALQSHARASGLRFGVDLAARSAATVGGMIATNAGGLHAVRYGPMRSQVIGIEAVLANGSVVGDLRGLTKDNTGYHLPSLLCGSEGTLAVVTSARLKLMRPADELAVALLAFDDVDTAVRAAVELRRSFVEMQAIEMVTAPGVRLVCDTFGLAWPFADEAEVALLVEAVGSGAVVERFADAVDALRGVCDAKVATDPERARALWQYRERHTEAIATLGSVHKLDVSLPLRGLAAFVKEIEAAVHGLRPEASVWLFGHVGDGNVHVNITNIAPDDDEVDALVFGEVARRGGSISAEHGIGRTKRSYLHLNRSEAEIAMMRSIKSALDPLGILAPGVLLPDS